MEFTSKKELFEFLEQMKAENDNMKAEIEAFKSSKSEGDSTSSNEENTNEETIDVTDGKTEDEIEEMLNLD